MRVLVALSEVTVLDEEFEIAGNAIDERHCTHELNEWDAHALEEAARLAETNDDTEVVTVTVGPERAERTIREGLAKGADRAIRVWDESLDETDLAEPAQKAQLLAGVVNELEPELVIAGTQSSDDTFGATGVALAARAGYEWAAVVNKLELDRADGVAHVRRELEAGMHELTDVALPAVISVHSGINEPRYAGLQEIRRAQKKPIEQYSPAAFGVEPRASRLSLLSLSEPAAAREGARLEGDAEAAADELAGRLSDMEVDA
ncbi:MAG: Electron transfer flavoprotein, beta subunit [halophilic archaeon J07HX5]|jgi:Electron transfer flavoprotein, beta subunit|nr:MAG: Electron transfer flavoprotein, beta subunit [halophilic archaeon J07HX5]